MREGKRLNPSAPDAGFILPGPWCKDCVMSGWVYIWLEKLIVQRIYGERVWNQEYEHLVVLELED